MSQPMDSFEPVTAKGTGPEVPKSRRWLRAVKWLLFLLVLLLGGTYLHTASYGTQAVRAAVQAEALASYQELKSRAPGAVDPIFRGAEITSCRAIFPGLITCSYSVYRGPKAAAGYDDLYLWNGWSCERLRHEMGWVS